MSDQLLEINICDVDLDDKRYKVSFPGKDTLYLAVSIRDNGTLFPPIVRYLNGRYIVISGFNRVKASLSNNEKTIIAYAINPDLHECQYIIKSIISLSFQRPLTHAELTTSIGKLNEFMEIHEIAKRSIGIFNSELNTRIIQDYINLKSLSETGLQLLHKGVISFKTAKKIITLPEETIKMLLNLFSKIKASNNKQLEILQYIMEISKRDQIKFEKVIENSEIQHIISDKNREPVLKTKFLREFLHKKRFPALFTARQSTRQKISNLKFGKQIKFTPPENFEGLNYSLSFTAKNYKEFLLNVKKLNEVVKNRELKEILEQ